jgi:hypothetical protein
MTTQWKVEITFGSSNITKTWELKIKNLKKKKDLVYEFDANGINEEQGDSKITGVLLFKGNQMALCF